MPGHGLRNYRSSTQSFHSNNRIIPLFDQDHFLPQNFQFIFHCLLVFHPINSELGTASLNELWNNKQELKFCRRWEGIICWDVKTLRPLRRTIIFLRWHLWPGGNAVQIVEMKVTKTRYLSWKIRFFVITSSKTTSLAGFKRTYVE
jgi:hypothetical protein